MNDVISKEQQRQRLCIKPIIQERGTECGERREWGECYIPGNVTKHSGECSQTFRGMSPNILGNIAKHSGECPQIFRGMSPNIPGNVLKHFGEYNQTFREMSQNIPGNVAELLSLIAKCFTVYYVDKFKSK